MSVSVQQLVLILTLAVAVAILALKITSLILITIRRRTPIATQKFLKPELNLRLGTQSFPVRYCSEQRFTSLFRLLPWEAVGVLFVTPDKFIFHGKTNSGELLEHTFERYDARLSYINSSFMRDGGLSWFVIETDEALFYFASEMGMPDLEHSYTTTGMYEAVTDLYLEELTASHDEKIAAAK